MKKNYIIIAIYSILVSSFTTNFTFAQDELETHRDTINFVIVDEIIGGVNKTDALASMVLTMNEMVPNYKNYLAQIKPDIVNSVAEIKELIKQNKADIVGLFSLDYLEYKSELPLEPIFIVEREIQPGDKYVLVVKNDNRINSLSDLKSKLLYTYESRESEIINKWIFVEMKKEKVSNPSSIISAFVKISKPTMRLFPVFFGKADACIVSDMQFKSMCELNPQLKKKLKILVESPYLLTHVFSRNTDSKKYNMHNSGQYAISSTNTKQGQQLLKLFKATKVTKFEGKFLDPLQELVKEYNYYKSK